MKLASNLGRLCTVHPASYFPRMCKLHVTFKFPHSR